MKPRPRMRATIKWGGAVITVLLLIGWVGSRWYTADVRLEATIAIGAVDGQLVIGWNRPWTLVPEKFDCFFGYDYYGRFSWWFHIYSFNKSAVILIPIWFLVLLTGVPTFLIWRRRKL